MRGLLNGAVKLVILQFSCSENAVPPGLFKKERESVNKLIARKRDKKGEPFLESTKGVGLQKFGGDLASVDYTLVDAFYQMRVNARGQDFASPRFTFALEVYDEGEFASHREGASKAFEQLCNALWSIEGYLNPHFKNGEDVKGEHTISLNMAARDPLVDKNGKPILQWQKDEKGERIGATPVPLQSKLFLRIQDGDVKVVPAE